MTRNAITLIIVTKEAHKKNAIEIININKLKTATRFWGALPSHHNVHHELGIITEML